MFMRQKLGTLFGGYKQTGDKDFGGHVSPRNHHVPSNDSSN